MSLVINVVVIKITLVFSNIVVKFRYYSCSYSHTMHCVVPLTIIIGFGSHTVCSYQTMGLVHPIFLNEAERSRNTYSIVNFKE